MTHHTNFAPKRLLGHYDVPRLVAPVFGGGFRGLGDAAALQRAKESKQQAALNFQAIAAGQIVPVNTAMKSAAFGFTTKGTTVVNGKAQVPVSSFWSQWNIEAAKLIAPLAGVVNGLPISSTQKSTLKSRPLDALLDIFDPFEAAFGRAIDRVIAKKGSTQTFFGKAKNIKRVQEVDTKADAATQNLMRRLRTIDAFIVLFWTQPLDLAAECAKEGLDLAGSAAAAVADTAANVAKAAGKAVSDIANAAAHAASDAAAWFGLGGLNGLGEVATATAVTAATGVAAGTGVSVDAILTTVITTLGSIITAAVAAFLTGGDAKGAGQLEAQRQAGLIAQQTGLPLFPVTMPGGSPGPSSSPGTALIPQAPIVVTPTDVLPPSSGGRPPVESGVVAKSSIPPAAMFAAALLVGFVVVRAVR